MQAQNTPSMNDRIRNDVLLPDDVISDRISRRAREDGEIVNEIDGGWRRTRDEGEGGIAKFCGGIMNNVVASRVDKTSFIFTDAR